MPQNFDVLVIGAGPGGYVAAIRAAQLGFKVACVDEFKNPAGQPSLGGTCLNVGCIPSKALLESSENFARAAHGFAAHGIAVDGLRFDAGQMQARKNEIVTKLTQGIAFLFKKNKITSLHGHGRMLGREGEVWQVEVNCDEAREVAAARHVILATGSKPRMLPGVEIDNVRVLDNAGALALDAVPARLGVIGAGVIGLELGSVWRRLGAEVTLLEAMPAFLPAADQAVAREALRLFTRDHGLKIQTGVEIQSVKAGQEEVIVHWKSAKDGEQTATFDKLLVCVGRAPNVEGLLADGVALQRDERGFVVVDETGRTSLPDVWAIGDVTPGPMLAHRASEEGVAVAERIAGQKPHVDFSCIPWVMYTSPEIAWVGKTEQQLQAEGVDYKKGQFPFAANGRALALGESAGFVKMLACAKTDRILGVHAIGPMASELIAEAVVAMEFKASSEDIARIVHAHPSLSEALHEAALGCDKRGLHS
ncbi:dihydrolipoamide dehydrogenase [Formivibrio citricus]|uniref:Dihydrolipoyl dehydrogenase n=1 Tax=Formivibrio citricus TaxID=83765 RepID=A0A1I4V270_9NEIS|nr:dihydrolipoyl dehydrogenase [Formivibrio citricus]SFM95296.1 dihydrolipoamide dehydrogenase [Formivibrio citricus]